MDSILFLSTDREAPESMDWAQAGQIMGAFASGAAGLVAVQKVLKRMKSSPMDKPVSDGERSSLVRQLTRIERIGEEQNRLIAAADGRMSRMERRFRELESEIEYLKANSRAAGTD